MYIGFDLRIDENAEIFDGVKDYEELRKIGETHLHAQKAIFEEKLEAYVVDKIIDGSKIQDEWFPQIEADIFISHSGKDGELANALAGWIYDRFGLRCFIDSNVWGYSNTLLELLNSKLSNKREDADGGYLYNHESCNRVSQHVNTMLSIALQKMIDKTEAVILLNTDNSVKVCSDKQIEKTYSPWIYSEIVCTQLVRKKPLLTYRNYRSVYKAYFGINESVQFLQHFDISYSVSLSHLKLLSEDDLLRWMEEYLLNKQNYEYALDALYEFICPHELESARKLSGSLTERELNSLQHAYSASGMNIEEQKNVRLILNRIIRRTLLCCEECEMFRDTLD